MRKVDIGRQGLRDILVLGELQSVVIGDGVDLVLRSIMSNIYGAFFGNTGACVYLLLCTYLCRYRGKSICG